MPHLTLPATEGQSELLVYYEAFGARPGAPVLILLHELGGSIETWRTFAEMLAPAVHVVAFDQRCAGASEQPPQPFTLWDLAEDTHRLVQALAIGAPFGLMGLAMGAVTALHFATRYPALLSTLVLCDGTGPINERASRYLLDQAASVRRDGMRAIASGNLRNAFRGMADPELHPEAGIYNARFTCCAPTGYSQQAEALAGYSLTDEHLAKVTTPTLVLTGGNDVIWPPATGEALVASLPNATFEVVEGAAHFPPLQAPRWVANRVANFVGRS